MDDQASELSAELGRDLPAELASLPAETLRKLAGVVRDAKQTRLEGIDKATDEALAQLPMMLRGPARKVLGK